MVTRRACQIPSGQHPLSVYRQGILVLLMILSLLCGCGMKAPPVVPRQPAMQAVTDLSVARQEGMLVLSWHHQLPPSGVTGYVIYRAPSLDPDSDCNRCPLLFERIGQVALDPNERLKRHLLSYRSPMGAAAGPAIYKVVPVQSSGAQGPDSNLVEIDTTQ